MARIHINLSKEALNKLNTKYKKQIHKKHMSKMKELYFVLCYKRVITQIGDSAN